MTDRQGGMTDRIKPTCYCLTHLLPDPPATAMYMVSNASKRAEVPPCYCHPCLLLPATACPPCYRPLPASAWPTCYCLAYLLLPPACYCLAYLLLPPCLLQPAPPAAYAWSQVPHRRECPGCGWTRVSSSGPSAHTAQNLQDEFQQGGGAGGQRVRDGCQRGGGAGVNGAREMDVSREGVLGVEGAGWMSAGRGCWGSRVQDGCQQGGGAGGLRVRDGRQQGGGAGGKGARWMSAGKGCSGARGKGVRDAGCSPLLLLSSGCSTHGTCCCCRVRGERCTVRGEGRVLNMCTVHDVYRA